MARRRRQGFSCAARDRGRGTRHGQQERLSAQGRVEWRAVRGARHRAQPRRLRQSHQGTDGEQQPHAEGHAFIDASPLP